MNYKKYYEEQAASGFPVFRGYPNQRGHGLGSIFKNIFKFVLPLFKTHALPVLKRGAEVVGAEAIKTAAGIANDAIRGKNIRDSAREHVSDAINVLSEKAQSSLQSGSGRKRKYLKPKKKNNFILKKPRLQLRRVYDIFDKK